MAAVYLPDGPAAAVWTGTQLVCLAVATGALTRRAAVHRSGWWILLAGCGVGVASGSLHLIPPADRSDWAWFVALAVRYVLLIAGLILLLEFRRTQTAEQAFLDAGIVAVGLAMVGWTFLVEPSLSQPAGGPPPPEAMYSSIALDLVMLVCLVRITFGELASRTSRLGGGRSRTPTMLLLAAAGGVVVIADVASTLSNPAGLSEYQPGGLIHLAWQVSGVLVCAAALHPSFGVGHATRGAGGGVEVPPPGRHTETAARPGTIPPIRLAAFVAIALVAPVVPLLGLLCTGHDVPADILPAMAGSSGLTAILVVLLVTRLGLVARLASRRAHAMNVQAAALVVQSTALQQALEDQQVLQRELAHRAQHDPLTGVANRSLLLERLEQALTTGSGHAGALLLLDLDGFKEVNNTLGHPAGDDLLVQVAQRLREAAGEAYTVARLGGDEFAVLMAGADEDSSWQTADRVVEALRRPFPIAERQVELAASGGLLPLDVDVRCPIDTLRDVDLALYVAKQAGKNQVVEFRPQMREARLRYAQLAQSVRAAVAGDGLSVLYQPIVDLASGRPVALEALARWPTADGRQLPPDKFIAVAEDIGLVADLGARVLRDACGQASRWHGRYDVALSVNVSGRQVATSGFADGVLAVLEETDLPPQALILEIKETALVGPAPAVQDSLGALRRHGIRVAVDDFGTGYSSLSYLHRMPIDILKLDRALTATLDSAGGRGASFVSAILGLGAGLGVPTVGEGVETARQADLLRELACPMAQGYHFSAPSPADRVSEYLASGPVDARA